METFPFESVTPAKLHLYNNIVGRARDATFQLGEHTCHFSFIWKSIDYHPAACFKIKLSDYTVWVGLEKLPPLEVFAKDLKGVVLEELPSEFQPVVLEGLLEPILDKLEEKLGALLSIEQYLSGPPESSGAEVVHFRLDYPMGQLFGQLIADTMALEYLEALIGKKYKRNRSPYQDLEIPVRLVIGEAEISLKEFNGLNLRDLILFDATKIDQGLCQAVIGSRMIFSAHLQGKKVTLNNLIDMIDEDNEPEESTEDVDEMLNQKLRVKRAAQMPEAAAENAEGDISELNVNRLPVHLVFEVGQKRISLADLTSIQAGFTFELSSSVESPVTIRANGRVVGEGELLKIGDRVGVRVSRFKDHG